MATANVEVYASASSIRPKDLALVGDKSNLIQQVASFAEDANDLLSIINVNTKLHLFSTMSTVPASSVFSANRQPVCDLNAINNPSMMDRYFTDGCFAVAWNLVEGSSTTTTIRASREGAATVASPCPVIVDGAISSYINVTVI